MTSFEKAKEILYGTIASTGKALENACRRRTSTVDDMRAFMERIQLDISGLSVIHVTGTKGKGSTCAMAESVLRQHGFRTGLFTSPHLLEVTERIRLNGIPLEKESFATYFFQVWHRLVATCSTPASGEGAVRNNVASAESVGVSTMPGYFHLLTLVGLWVFVQEKVDVCIVEVGVGGRYDATNVVPPPVACGVALLDLDHTQILGNTLVKIAWQKGGIFKKGCAAFTVEQSESATEVLRQCAADAGCTLEVVPPLASCDPTGAPYEIGIAADHQRINAALAVSLCRAWLLKTTMRCRPLPAADERKGEKVEKIGVGGGCSGSVIGEGGDDVPSGLPEGSRESNKSVVDCGSREAFMASQAVHRGLAGCTWPGRCQVFRPRSHPSVTVYLDGAHTEQSVHACVQWYMAKTRAAERSDGVTCENDRGIAIRRRCVTRRILWFNASHERAVVPILDPLVKARAHDTIAAVTSASAGAGETRPNDDEPQRQQKESDGNCNDDEDDKGRPLFDEAWFVEVPSGRPSMFTPATAHEILEPHGLSVGSGLKESQERATVDRSAARPRNDEETSARENEAAGGAWQRTLQQVWLALQRRKGKLLSITGIGTVPDLVANLEGQSSPKLGITTRSAGNGSVSSLERHPRRSDVAADDIVTEEAVPSGICGVNGRLVDTRASDEGAKGGVDAVERVEILCTGSLHVVSAVLAAFGAEVL